jgi:DNA repair protein RadD
MSPALAQGLDRPPIAGDALEQYRRHADHRPAIAFCITIDHATRVTEVFGQAGYRSQAVHGRLTAPEHDRLIAGFGTDAIEVLTSCELISEGLDVPSVGAVILLRPTKSFVLHAQQIGRGLRPAPGKDALVVLDHAGSVVDTGRPIRNGYGAFPVSRSRRARRRSGRVRHAAS